MTLTQTIAKSLAWAMALFLLCAGAMTYIWYVDTANMVPGTDEAMMEIRPHAKGTVNYVIEKNDCVEHKSTGPNDWPSAVIFQDKTGRAHYSTKSHQIGKALDEGLGGPDWKNHTVNIFCK